VLSTAPYEYTFHRQTLSIVSVGQERDNPVARQKSGVRLLVLSVGFLSFRSRSETESVLHNGVRTHCPGLKATAT
jgi:hypothetical protein